MSYSTREVHFYADDADIMGTGTLSLCLEDRGRGGGGERSLDCHCSVGKRKNWRGVFEESIY